MRAFALTCEALAHLDATEAKVQCAAAYLIARPNHELPAATRFLAGTPLPPGTPAPRAGAAAIAGVVAELAGVPAAVVRRRGVNAGDLGIAVAELLETAGQRGAADASLTAVEDIIAHLGAQAATARTRSLRRLFRALGPLEAKYVTKLLLGSLRTGMRAGRVEEAIAIAFCARLESVRRAHMLLGDLGPVAERARVGTLEETRLRAFRPVRCMLAHPAGEPSALLAHITPPLIVEPKLDGVRAQLHLDGVRHRLYSRSLEDLTHLFPELGDGGHGLSGEWILDGEIVAWSDAPLPFETLQQRLGRRQVPLTMLIDIPVVYQAFDVLRAGGVDLIDEPLERRKEALAALPAEGPVRRLSHDLVGDAKAIAAGFDAAIAAGHEGLVAKDPRSVYVPGTRGRQWLKLKRPLATLDVVVTAAEYGSGKRAGWLSDLTFAVRDPDGELRDVGKAYSGLTDEEIRALTEHFKATTTRRAGARHEVEPSVILEVAFSGVQRSRRHDSGFALRFPRIVRRRHDLGLEDIDVLESLDRLLVQQKRRRQTG